MEEKKRKVQHVLLYECMKEEKLASTMPMQTTPAANARPIITCTCTAQRVGGIRALAATHAHICEV